MNAGAGGPRWRGVAVALGLGLATGWTGCALPTPAVEQVLGPAGAEAAPAGAVPTRAQLDQRARLALQQARRSPDDVKRQIEAARSLFFAADARMVAATVALAPHATDLATLIDADDALPDDVRAQVRSLVEPGLAAAERATELAPDRIEARLYLALHLSLSAWSRGVVRSLLAGMGTRVGAAIDRAAALDPAYAEAAPLRLRGRFLTRAPWPLRDLAEARRVLQRAAELAPNPVNLTFLGDAEYLDGGSAAARRHWQAACDAEADLSQAPTALSYRGLAKRRLELLQ